MRAYESKWAEPPVQASVLLQAASPRARPKKNSSLAACAAHLRWISRATDPRYCPPRDEHNCTRHTVLLQPPCCGSLAAARCGREPQDIVPNAA